MAGFRGTSCAEDFPLWAGWRGVTKVKNTPPETLQSVAKD